MFENYNFFHRIKVRWSEIDGMNMVFNAHYLTYIDIAITEYFEEGLKLDLRELARTGKFEFVLVKSTLEFKNPAKMGDWLKVGCKPKAIGNNSFTFSFEITREQDNELILLAEIVYVSYDSQKGSSVPVPDFLRERIHEFEKNGTVVK